ncbi:hypothetical protein ACS2QD_30570, partial [Bacillus cereus group sp. Bce036]|uniref:hypothetical protein n=1 Tax=Bacillus cereus group sp. Bce036 TaxID=3445233 RepID=UPI003F23C12B
MSISQAGTSTYIKVIDPCTFINDRDFKTIIDEFKLTREIVTEISTGKISAKRYFGPPFPLLVVVQSTP